ncbi:MAG TPA: LPS export ABC transporter periplasmic protein LptC [Paludibacter sp.]
MKNNKTNFSVSTIFMVVVMLFFMIACSSKEEADKIGAIVDRSALPQLHATEITTVISDSGITRYRISASRWDVYDKASKPYWDFPNGIHFEKFDANLKVDANIHSQYARFNENEQLWELKGKVKAMNLQGELFETEQLFWNQREERMYSDSLIKITQVSQITTGIGFESNQNMTRYTIRKVVGIIAYSEKDSTATPVVPKATPITPNK